MVWTSTSDLLPPSVTRFPFQCLPDPNNYHEFCRLLARLKSNYQLGELVKVENYPEVIRLIANFTVTSLQVGANRRKGGEGGGGGGKNNVSVSI